LTPQRAVAKYNRTRGVRKGQTKLGEDRKKGHGGEGRGTTRGRGASPSPISVETTNTTGEGKEGRKKRSVPTGP